VWNNHELKNGMNGLVVRMKGRKSSNKLQHKAQKIEKRRKPIPLAAITNVVEDKT